LSKRNAYANNRMIGKINQLELSQFLRIVHFYRFKAGMISSVNSLSVSGV
jgi:hypothetical protein